MLAKFGGLLAIAAVVFWLWAIFDSLTAEDSRIRVMPKVLWVIVVLVFFEFGALVWVLFGRPRRAVPAGSNSATGFGFGSASRLTRPGGKPPRSGSGPVGPDDDPDFLSSI
ncbi:MAG TPA: PLD nuclease N-terminal domain-containing protein [Jatrophihabitans sp.]|jgi:hypothetical protein